MPSTELVQLRDFYKDQLLKNVVPFWFPKCVDQQYGGFLHCVDRDGSVVDSDKSIWAQGRMAWMLLTLYQQVEPNPNWLEWAESGLAFLQSHGFDPSGRMYFHVTQQGKPIRLRRYAYSEAFAAIAWGAHYRITGNEHSQAMAEKLFRHYVHWNFTPGVMPPKYETTRPMISLAPRMIAIVTAMELEDVLLNCQSARDLIATCISDIKQFFLKPDLQCVMESVGPQGEIVDHFDGRTLNPGHAIEGAWFMMSAGERFHRPDWIADGCQMLDWMWRRGWDCEHGGIFYYRDVYDRPVQEYWHDMKFWWPHNEALIATILAWRLTGQQHYWDWHQQVRQWSFAKFADREFGEWFGYLHRDGQVSVTLKGNLWKSFFHHPRSLLMCWQNVQAAIDVSEQNG